MAHRIQMKLGVVPDVERAPDSPDTALHIEPRVGAQTRTKGHLYLLVTSRVPGSRARDATRLVADAIRSEYYYDESAGIRVCLVKAIQVANKRLSHARERSALGGADPGPIGVALAVVRDNELYVCTVGPAEAYLNRGARLSILPDPHRDRGLPSSEVEPDVWRGEINVGDQLVLVSPSVIGALGADVLKDALVTLHPQSAVESLTARFRASGGGAGSDGALILEAAEIAVTRSGVAPVPVRPAEPLAGMPDRSPIPLVDSVSSGLAAAQSGARRARGAAGGVLYRLFTRIQDRLPSRGVPNRRVTPLSTRREMQRRAAMAVLALLVVVVGLVGTSYLLGGRQPTGPAIATLAAAQTSLETARANLNRVIGPGIDLVVNAPQQAEQLLTQAYTSIQAASAGGIPTTTTGPIKAQIVAQLDRLYKMADVASTALFTFPDAPAVDLKALVKGPDGAPFVLDAATKSVYRIDLANRKAAAIFRAGNKPSTGGVEGTPVLIGVGGRDLLMVDDKNVVWRWRPANTTGKGTITRVHPISGSTEWGSDVLAIGTFIRDSQQNLYNLYVVDPSQQQILRYSPAADGGGFPNPPNNWLTAARDLSRITSMYIDGDVWLADGGQILRLVSGNSAGWTAAAPGDTVVRGTPAYGIIASGSDRRTGTIYGYDRDHQRVVALAKVDGAFIGQYRLSGAAPGWSDLRGLYVQQGLDGEPDTLVWLGAKAIESALLQPVGAGPSASAAPSAPVSPKPSR